MPWTIILGRLNLLPSLLDDIREFSTEVLYSDEYLYDNAIGKAKRELMQRDEQRLRELWPTDRPATIPGHHEVNHARHVYGGVVLRPELYGVLYVMRGTVEVHISGDI